MSDLSSQGTTRRFGWYRPKFDGKFDLQSFDYPLNNEIWSEFEYYASVADALRPFLIDWLALNADADALLSLCDANATSGVQALPTFSAGVADDTMLQRRLAHFVHSTFDFCSRLSARLKAQGKSSAELRAFDAAMIFWREHSSAFNLVLNLGRLVEARQLPVTRVTLKNPARATVLLLPMSPLTDTDLSEKSLPELADKPIDIAGLVPDALVACGGLMLRILQFHASELPNLGHYIRGLYDRFAVPPGGTVLVWEGSKDNPDPRAQARATELRAEDVEMILALYERLQQGPLSPAH